MIPQYLLGNFLPYYKTGRMDDMDIGDVITISRQTIWIIIKTAVPILLVSMIVGLIISLFQTLTSIQEQTLTFLSLIHI